MASPARLDKRPVTVLVLAMLKRLPPGFLKKLGLHDLDNGLGVGIPYYDRGGDLVATKRRAALAAKDGSRWPAGKPLMAYGDWRLHDVATAGWLILVEGESDCWTLWHHGFPAIGLPGSGTAKTLTAEHLVGVEKLFIHVEDDDGGAAFRTGLLHRLAELNFTGQVFTFRMPDGIKDPSALHIQDQGTFVERFNLALQATAPHTPTHLHVQIPGATAAPGAETPAEPREETRDVSAVRLIDVHEEQVRWLWPGRIPLGKLTILDGDPGLGKSTVTLDIAARVTTGRAMPALPEAALPAAHVVLLTAEDGLGDTIRPRLAAAAADLDKVTALEGIKLSSGVLLPIYLPNNITDVARIVRATSAVLVLIDPLMAYLPESVNSASDQSVRQALLPLSDFAQASGAAVLVVRHLNKQPGKNVLYRGGGSIGIIGAARSGLLIARDNDNPNRRFLGVTKSNLCKQPRTLAFELREGAGCAVVQWQDEVDVAIEEVLASAGAEEGSDVHEADAFLQTRLSAGPVPAPQVFEDAASLRISESTLKRAKKRLHVKSDFVAEPSGKGGHWVWRLPDAA
jgi:hypothetical protein